MPDQDELLTKAVRLLGERDRLRGELDAGAAQLASGQYTDYDSAAPRQRFREPYQFDGGRYGKSRRTSATT